MTKLNLPFFGFVSIFFLAFAGWYFADPEERLPISQPQEQIQSIILDLQVTNFNKEGRADSRVYAPRVEQHFDGNTVFKQPRIKVFRNNEQAPWVISANYAKADKNFTSVKFWQDVLIQQRTPDNQNNIFKTQYLEYYPKKNIAYTTDDIHYQQPGISIDSKGMRADLKTQKIQLLQQARGNYEPKTS